MSVLWTTSIRVTKHLCRVLTHWGRVTHICVSKLTIIGSDNGLAPVRRQAITWTKAGILLIGPLETSFSEILIEIHAFAFKKMHLKMSSGKWRPCWLGLDVLRFFLISPQHVLCLPTYVFWLIYRIQIRVQVVHGIVVCHNYMVNLLTFPYICHYLYSNSVFTVPFIANEVVIFCRCRDCFESNLD